ncbi:MAG: hypothetical protein CO186_03410 [Zetaproteobacteria bacterium CG_4_9_14_3_um_filter_49_83]|nr:MAG: hypothetical protein AUJ56_00130 [Zetaproteobacteria bacterium CG1_02_49_23]PIQ32553.1 MAG: hypothetical protein COW62_07315 [Zetaproteobacteria bacterium CG17_big_fil_post_rev_8_21_14_2_50_50_13]PIV31142.1 MAG: hypothetical protein COS35_02950 [Zetaproteobacteria bacterium CG02_land_8_20_14_3_00_50_9]PIY56129.1 MAG: hypothetical protein COZ00_05805 [Zetaproteobacteria bacterium CG_4_10_14_0_8_um_filter_49_80]PJA35910.1 MAG: hypothetical protein CO186_03410 [Zetaproteobacteria bacterium
MKLLSILVVLALLVAYTVMQRSEKSVGDVPRAMALEQTLVYGITLRSDFQPEVVLKRQGDAWTLSDSTPANEELVQRLLSDLADMHVSRIVARSGSHDLELGLSAKDAVHLILQDEHGQTLMQLDIGRQGGDLLSTFVRYGGDEKVLAMDKSLVWQVRRNRDGWKQVQADNLSSDTAANETAAAQQAVVPADAVLPMPEQAYQQP